MSYQSFIVKAQNQNAKASVSVTIPKTLCKALDIKKGDKFIVTVSSDNKFIKFRMLR